MIRNWLSPITLVDIKSPQHVSCVSYDWVVSFIDGDVPIENNRSVGSHKLYHLKSYRVRVASGEVKLQASVVIGIDCVFICYSKYYTTTPNNMCSIQGQVNVISQG